jgi:hypothetical protein
MCQICIAAAEASPPYLCGIARIYTVLSKSRSGRVLPVASRVVTVTPVDRPMLARSLSMTNAQALAALNLLVAAAQTGFGPFLNLALTGQGWSQTQLGVALKQRHNRCACLPATRQQLQF